jgi:outer membrane lipoprotein carrier protein
MTALAAVFVALLAAPAAKDSAAKDGRALAKRVQAFYAHTKDFSARFAQHYTYTALGKVEDSTGTVEVKKPGLVRWDYETPEKRTIFVDGKTLWIWKPQDQEAQVKRNFGGEQLSSAFTFLWGKGDLLKEFSAKAVPVPEGLPKGEGLELLPVKPSAGVQKLLFVVAPDGQVLASVLTNPQGDVNQIVFSESKIDQGLDSARFHFEPPKGAYVQEF